MAMTTAKMEQRFFRALNGVVEPAVRRGIFSSSLLPTTLIVLESVGYKSGLVRRTPLFCQQLGSHVLISTGRGKRSFWVRNVAQQGEVSYFIGGRKVLALAQVFNAQNPAARDHLPPLLRPFTGCLNALIERGWAFTLLAPR